MAVGKTVLVTGSRELHPKFTSDVRDVLLRYIMRNDIVVEGGARGVDAYIRDWCQSCNLPVHEVPADWKRDGKAAGPIRNQRMLDDYDIDLVLAFPGPDSRGTWDMVRRAANAGKEVYVFPLVEGATWTSN